MLYNYICILGYFILLWSFPHWDSVQHLQFYFCFWSRVSFLSPGWPRTHNVDQVDLTQTHGAPLASAFQVLWLQRWNNILCKTFIFENDVSYFNFLHVFLHVSTEARGTGSLEAGVSARKMVHGLRALPKLQLQEIHTLTHTQTQINKHIKEKS